MNANYIKPRNSNLKSGKNLVLVRAGLFYGLQYFPIKEEKNSINRGITVTPNFLFYDNNTKVIIDFSDFKNSIPSKEIEQYWNLVQTNMSFTVTNGKIFNQATSVELDVSGTYVFKKFENLAVHANVTSATSLSTKVNLYSKNEFQQTPGFEFTTIIEPAVKEKRTKIINKMGQNTKNSFTYFGANIDDYIQLQNFSFRYRIVDIAIDSEGKEVITIEGTIPEEDRTSTKTFVGLYIEKMNSREFDVNPSETVIGSCSMTNNGLILSCFGNQTESQCNCRAGEKEQPVFNVSANCPSAQQEEQELNSTQLLTEIASNLVDVINKKQTTFNTGSLGNFSSFSNPNSIGRIF